MAMPSNQLMNDEIIIGDPPARSSLCESCRLLTAIIKKECMGERSCLIAAGSPGQGFWHAISAAPDKRV
jgi:hypothetical protein